MSITVISNLALVSNNAVTAQIAALTAVDSPIDFASLLNTQFTALPVDNSVGMQISSASKSAETDIKDLLKNEPPLDPGIANQLLATLPPIPVTQRSVTEETIEPDLLTTSNVDFLGAIPLPKAVNSDDNKKELTESGLVTTSSGDLSGTIPPPKIANSDDNSKELTESGLVTTRSGDLSGTMPPPKIANNNDNSKELAKSALVTTSNGDLLEPRTESVLIAEGPKHIFASKVVEPLALGNRLDQSSSHALPLSNGTSQAPLETAILAGESIQNSPQTPNFAALLASQPHTPLQQTNRHETPTVSTPLHGQQWAQDFGDRIVWIAKNEQQSAQINITPAQLGPVQITIHLNGDQASAVFASPHAEVRQAIQDALPHLREMLTTAGINLGQANVGAQLPQQNRESSSQFSNKNRSSGENAILSPDSLTGTTSAGMPIQRGRGLVDLFA